MHTNKITTGWPCRVDNSKNSELGEILRQRKHTRGLNYLTTLVSRPLCVSYTHTCAVKLVSHIFFVVFFSCLPRVLYFFGHFHTLVFCFRLNLVIIFVLHSNYLYIHTNFSTWSSYFPLRVSIYTPLLLRLFFRNYSLSNIFALPLIYSFLFLPLVVSTLRQNASFVYLFICLSDMISHIYFLIPHYSIISLLALYLTFIILISNLLFLYHLLTAFWV